MSYIVATLISAVVCAGLLGGAFVVFKKMAVGAVGAQRKQILTEIQQTQAELKTTLASIGDYVSKPQFDSIVQQSEKTKQDLASEKTRLGDIERKLDNAQKLVEEKETNQQEIKTAKEEEEQKVEELLARYAELSSESISLEQALAASMKALDPIMADASLNEEQKKILTELNEVMTTAGSRLRELITSYQQVNERLEMLKQQFSDLENEYTKLVERQLGE